MDTVNDKPVDKSSKQAAQGIVQRKMPYGLFLVNEGGSASASKILTKDGMAVNKMVWVPPTQNVESEPMKANTCYSGDDISE